MYTPREALVRLTACMVVLAATAVCVADVVRPAPMASSLQTAWSGEVVYSPEVLSAGGPSSSSCLLDAAVPQAGVPSCPLQRQTLPADAVEAGRIIPPAPSAPSGAAMALSGLLILGGCRWAKSMRDGRLASLPEWYHSHAPLQVGHATVVPDLRFVPLDCLSSLDCVRPALEARRSRADRAHLVRIRDLSAPDPRQPRAPPAWLN